MAKVGVEALAARVVGRRHLVDVEGGEALHRVELVGRVAEDALDGARDVDAAARAVGGVDDDRQIVDEPAMLELEPAQLRGAPLERVGDRLLGAGVDEKQRAVQVRARHAARQRRQLHQHRPHGAVRGAHARRRRAVRLVDAPAEEPAVGRADQLADRTADER